VITQMANALRAAGRDEATRARLGELGVEVMSASPAETARYMARETAQWAVVIKGAGIRAE
jgi:tripartite-type tricarboxylate transporter receptor subunit TctC